MRVGCGVQAANKKPAERAFFEADDEARTRDPQLGKLMLYQLSYVRATRILAPVF